MTKKGVPVKKKNFLVKKKNFGAVAANACFMVAILKHYRFYRKKAKGCAFCTHTAQKNFKKKNFFFFSLADVENFFMEKKKNFGPKMPKTSF